MPNWLQSRSWLFLIAVVGLVIASPGQVFANDQAVDEDEEPVRFPGIVGTYTAGGRTVSRRDADVAFVWGTTAPVQELPAGPFQAEWQGKLLVRAPGKYRFYAQVQGQVEATLAGQGILAGQSDANAPARWISGPEVEFEYGEHPLVVKFQSTGPSARLKLYWSSEAFALEPIPTGAYFLNEARPEFELIAQGQVLFAAHRCNRCHLRQHDPQSPAGPDLKHVAQHLTHRGLDRWLTSERPPDAAHFNMPEFGFTPEESRDVACFLRATSGDPPARLGTPFKPEDRSSAEELAAGKALLLTRGCLACHSYREQGSASRLGGGDLSNIGDKRDRDWLKRWLTDPAAINPDHRMPVFEWKKDGKHDELNELSAFLASSTAGLEYHGSVQTGVDPAPVERGKKLVEAARCAACHRIPGIAAPDLSKLSSLELLTDKHPDSCLQDQPNRKNWRPGFPQKDLAALRAYVKSRAGRLTPEGPVERGQRVLAWNNCLQCHPREGVSGLGAYAVSITKLLPELGGSVPTLVPPSLNAVGDKLRDEALLKSVAGEFAASRLPWLKVKMPRFKHSDEDRQALAHYVTDHDRLDSPPADLVAVPPVPDVSQRPEALIVGHSLLGSQGFSCIACHQFGKFQPRNAALGTRGSDLQNIGVRMRREYFLRWTRSPIRIVPDMEMPGFERPFPGLLGSQIQPQLAALWEALHDPNPTRPLDVSSLQQSWVVRAGEPARIIRDVFALPQTKDTDVYVPRSFAVGLNNQHNILFDLDTFAVREWWQGNFARQRTEGKSWYWDVAGTRVTTGLRNQSSIALVRDRQNGNATGDTSIPTLLTPLQGSEFSGRLIEYAPEALGVKLVYQLKFRETSDSAIHDVRVTESWAPLTGTTPGGQSGWSRKITVADVPEDFCPVLLRPEFHTTLGPAEVDFVTESPARWSDAVQQIPNATADRPREIKYSVVRLPDKRSGELHYRAQFIAPTLETPDVPVVLSPRESFTTVPGYAAVRLPLPRSIMPTALTWTGEKVLAFTSLKGHVYLARDTDGDGLEDKLDLFEEGLAAPYGIISDPADGSLLVAHKPEILRLIDTDKNGRADRRDIFATGWGYNDNYHDWTCGIVRDRHGNLFVGLGSDYTQPKRPASQQQWRGKILRINPEGQVTPIASGLRYPTGLAMSADGNLFVSDNQGEQNTFNELNHIVEGNRYGVPSREDQPPVSATMPPAIQIPHPWTRSINGIFFLPANATLTASDSGDTPAPHPFAGHGIGCEYDSRYLIRFTLQKVDDTIQGAVYSFSQDHVNPEQPNFEGTLSGGVSPAGDIYIGCIHDSGWLGGLNVGSIVQLKSAGQLPLGIRELRAIPEGFEVQFTSPVDPSSAALAANYTISAYTREWKGTYATPDSNRHVVMINQVRVADDQRRVVLHTDQLRAGYVYEVSCGKIGPTPATALWPATGHYTMNRLPVQK